MSDKDWMDAIKTMADRERNSSDGIAKTEILELEKIVNANGGQLSQAEAKRVVWLALMAVYRYSNTLAPMISGRVKPLRRSDIVDAVKAIQTQSRKAQSAKGARAKHEKDPKQVAKAGAFELWKERHAGQHPKLRTVEQFAMEVMRRWPVLTSSKVITQWSAAWTKSAREGTM